jgi:hypothetical protein
MFHIFLEKYCWDGWLATVENIPLIRAKKPTAIEALEDVLEQLATDGAIERTNQRNREWEERGAQRLARRGYRVASIAPNGWKEIVKI